MINEQTNIGFLTIKDAAKQTNVSEEYVRFLIHKKKLRVTKWGHKVFIKPQWLKECFENIRRRTSTCPITEALEVVSVSSSLTPLIPPINFHEEEENETVRPSLNQDETLTIRRRFKNVRILAMSSIIFFILIASLTVALGLYTRLKQNMADIPLGSFANQLFFQRQTESLLTNKYHEEIITTELRLTDLDAEEGDIVSLKNGLYGLTKERADKHMVGVVDGGILPGEGNPSREKVNVISAGIAFVRVSTINGEISTGDFISSSIIPGIAVKATTYGPVLGVALDDYRETNPRKIQRIRVAVEILEHRPWISITWRHITVVRYLLASLIVSSFVVAALVYAIRFAKSGLKALARGAILSSTVESSLMLSFFFALLVVLSGMTIAYLMNM